MGKHTRQRAAIIVTTTTTGIPPGQSGYSTQGNRRQNQHVQTNKILRRYARSFYIVLLTNQQLQNTILSGSV